MRCNLTLLEWDRVRLSSFPQTALTVDEVLPLARTSALEVATARSCTSAVMSATPADASAERIDAPDRVALPGLIDAHVHPMMTSADLASLQHEPVTLLAQRAEAVLEDMLRRGCTHRSRRVRC